MDRRRFLAAVGVALPASGCLDRTRLPGADQPEPDGETNGTTTPRGESETESDMVILLGNATSTERTVSVTLANDGATVLERELTAVPNGETAVETGIDRRGQYELTVAVESGPRETFPFSVEAYDLEAGSNLIVTIRDESVEIAIEE